MTLQAERQQRWQQLVDRGGGLVLGRTSNVDHTMLLEDLTVEKQLIAYHRVKLELLHNNQTRPGKSLKFIYLMSELSALKRITGD